MLFSKKDLNPDPLVQVSSLWDLAKSTEEDTHSNMVLATVNGDGVPSARVVLLKEIRSEGIVFYTNYGSQKGREIVETGKVSALLYWPALDIQVRFNGKAEKLSTEESERYFATRPRASQIGAWASQQSEVLPNRKALQEKITKYEEEFAGKEVPRPEYWGGFLITPSVVQILARRDHRLHDSYRYRRQGDQWLIERLSP